MRVLQIINSLGTGGAEKLLLDTIPLYRKAGVEMDVLLFWNNNHQFVNALKALDCCNVFVLNNSSNVKDIYHPNNILKLRKYLKQYDIAHIHLFPAQYFAVFANILNGNSCKLIFTEHNTFNRRMDKKYLLPIEKFVYRKYTKIVCISQEIKRVFSDNLNIENDKFILIHNGVNLSTLENANTFTLKTINSNLEEDDKLIIQVSAFRPQKDQKTLIRALSYVKDEKVKILLVGDGECREECENLVRQLGLGNRVLFLGQRIDVPSLLKSSDIVVLSSHYEGLSLSSIEGMASGNPFVASNVPGLKDIVDGAGVLFECGNEQELASEIKELLSNKEYYNKIIETCLLRSEQYDISLMVQKHLELYQEVYES
ncbi:glycosyltransferase [Mesoflavibacter zeaxanthinifaciens]|uniref:glycosyltransferase n=1 Tax=Mesoflavibacter zeaxanthinifaciens TaxID=393060 RepID=UPI003A9090CA